MISDPTLQTIATGPAETRVADRYKLERLLGQGGMGMVYVALDEVTGKRIALKRLAAQSGTRSEALFEHEYQTLVSLRHPAIVETYDYGRDAVGAYYTMELIEGSDLSSQAPLGWREACECLRDVASILGLLHARQLLHRDLSPRNLLRTSNQRLKLIDFGALASFGKSTEVVGTPPFVPPEALDRGMLDQRSDLFALGALGYWLITGVHAFPARTLKDLPRLWERTPALPSSLVALIESAQLEPVPQALDELLGALLRVSPAERPTDTTELIDRLNALANLEPESQDNAVEGYLNSKVLVGRTRERERVLAALHEAQAGRGQALLLEGEHGVGRTRFLEDASVSARLAGMLILEVDATHGDTPFAAANALCLLALAVLPESTQRAVAAHVPVLGRLSETLHERLGGGRLADSTGTPGGDRARTQNALRDLFLSLSQQRPLALMIDDLQALDEESQGLFAALAHAVDTHPLLLIASASRDGTHEPSAAVLSYRNVAARMHLLPLTAAETLELLRSVFGSPPYLERLAKRLHLAAEGNPGYCLELTEHLVRTGAARYHEGSWALPAELSADSLPSSRRAGYLARLERLSSEARVLAKLLSVPHHGPLTQAQCGALAPCGSLQADPLIAELVREGVLLASAVGYRFAHADLQRELQPELATFERERSHRILAEETLAHAGRSHDERLRAAVHFLRAGLGERARPLIFAAAESFTGSDLNSALRVAAPLFEEIYGLLKARGADPYSCAQPLAILAQAGYHVDRRYAARYGAEAIQTLSTLLKLELCRKLSRFLGRKLALFVTLIVAGIGLSLRRRGPSLPMVIRDLLSAAPALAGTAACCIDPDGAAQLANVIEPLTAFGADHAASIVHRFTMAMSYVVQDRLAFTNQELRSLIARLESDAPIRALNAGIRLELLAGCYFSLGVNEALREGTEVLRTADWLERVSPLYAMSADHLRESYSLRQGEVVKAELFRQRVEVHAVQLGSAWQVETWAPSGFTEFALRTNDAMVMKRSVRELARLSHEIPSLAREERRARGTYLMLRGKFAEAIPLLEGETGPLYAIGWARTRGTLARAHNGLGEHAQAKQICLDTIAGISPGDLGYAVMNLGIQIELARAHAGLGDVSAAQTLLASLLDQFGDCQDPLTLGLVHEAHVRVALQEGDLSTARIHLEQMAAQYRPTGLASLLQWLTTLTGELERAENHDQPGPGVGPRLRNETTHLLTRLQLVLNHCGDTVLSERAKSGLQIALELSSADEGFVVLQGEQGSAEVHLGSPPALELVTWARQQLHAASFDAPTVMTQELDSQLDSHYVVLGRMRYCAATLIARRGELDVVVGSLVLGFDGRVPQMPEPAVLFMIAAHLAK